MPSLHVIDIFAFTSTSIDFLFELKPLKRPNGPILSKAQAARPGKINKIVRPERPALS
jgi:hypothetical protein